MPYEPEGNPVAAQYVFVGEAPGTREMMMGRPLVGPSGMVFDECLQNAGIVRSDAYISNVFDFQVKKDKQGHIYSQDGELLYHLRSGFTERGRISIDRLYDELCISKANVVVPLGGVALEAICGLRGITKWRGSLLHSSLLGGRKCVPTIHPANSLHGVFVNRYYIRADFKRAKHEVGFPEVRRPKYDFQLFPTFAACMEALEDFLGKPRTLSVDIEVAQRQTSRICFADMPGGRWGNSVGRAISIPYGDGDWSFEQERDLWLMTARVLEDERTTKIFQNGIFDIQFLWRVHGILTKGNIDDTLIAHHIMYPEFSASLATLTSLYTDQPYYKDMVKHGDIDKEGG